MRGILLFIFVLSSQAFAIKEYYSLTKSIRSLGMGGAIYATSNDEYALFYNPSGLSDYKGDPEWRVSLTAITQFQTIPAFLNVLSLNGAPTSQIIDTLQQYQGTPLHLATNLFPFYLRKNFAIGLLLFDTKVNADFLGKDIDSTIDLTAISDSGLVIGYGRTFPIIGTGDLTPKFFLEQGELNRFPF